jgi:hypothetical protein
VERLGYSSLGEEGVARVATLWCSCVEVYKWIVDLFNDLSFWVIG